MSKWKMVRLGSINHYQGKTVNPMCEPNRKFELYSVPSYDNNHPEIVMGSEIGSSKRMVEEGDVLLCKINPRINRVWAIRRHTEYQLIASSEWIVLRSADIHPNYLVWCLRSKPFCNMMTNDVTGIGGSLTRAQPKLVSEYPIPIPPLETQKQIANTLDTAAELLAMRKQQLAALDNLIKATFSDMFGDPVMNEKGWATVSIEDLCSKVIDCPHNTPQYSDQSTGLYCIRSADIQNGYLDFNTTLQVDIGTFNQRNLRHAPSYNDIVFTREGGRLGNSARIPPNVDVCLGQRIMLFSVDLKSATSEFLWAALRTSSLQQSISSIVGGGAAPRVNIKDLIQIKCIRPPLLLQQQFAEIVTKIEEKKALVEKAIEETQYLFGSLMSQYFE